jgi:hypothetical protein
MPTGKLFTTDDFQLKYVFLEPESGLYLAGFTTLDRAEAYAGINGYETADPEKVKMSEIDAFQPQPSRLQPSPNSPIPTLPQASAAAPAAKGPPPVTRPLGIRRPGTRA